MSMLKTAFTINLSEKILPGLVSVGKFDGLNPSIVAATSSDKLLIHNPLRRAQNGDPRWSTSASGTDLTYLNINQTIKALTVGKLASESDHDCLVLGTPTSILIHDVMNNRDIFYREITDGVNAVCVGKVGNIDEPIAVAGGNCAIQGFNGNGEERYWTITGDNITWLTLADVDSDGTNELIVGSEDYDIRIFKEDAILLEINETDAVKCLCPLGKDCFGYALANGTVGVYYRKERLWRIKSKNQVVCIFGFDINDDGGLELITGWSNGKIDARNIESGEIIFKEKFAHGIAGVMSADYNLDGVEELIVCSVNGEVKGYTPAKKQEKRPAFDLSAEQETIRELMKKKQSLTLELKNVESSTSLLMRDEYFLLGKASTEDDEYGAIPADTQLKSALLINMDKERSHVQLNLQTTNETIIRAVIIFAEGIFKSESFVVHPPENEVSSTLSVPLTPPRDVPIDLHVKSLVGYKNSRHFHVFELSRHLPKFCMYFLHDKSLDKIRPNSFVTFKFNKRVDKLAVWFNRNFLLAEELVIQDDANLTFTALRTGRTLIFEANNKAGEITIRTEDMDLAGEFIQSIAVEFNITELDSVSQFPHELDSLKSFIKKVEEFQAVRQQLKAGIADNSLAIKTLIVRAEDARLLGEWKMLKQFYIDLNVMNKEVLNEYQIRSQNHNDMVENLKQINVIIQKSANLRVGPPKAKLIQLSRSAIKENNLNALAKIVCLGDV